MAYAAVASLSQTIHLILNHHQDSISPQLRIPITSVYQNTIFLLSFLEDYPDEADNWEERMRDVTNEAEDIIEILMSNLLLDSTVGSSKPKSKKGKYELRSHLNELERVAEDIESIAKGVKERHRQTAGGFNHNLTEIIDRLFGGSSCLENIAIVGRGGIGKTTLARNAYNHPIIVERFDIRAWVTVSQDYTSWGGIYSFLLNILRAEGQRNTSFSDNEHDQIELIRNFLCFRNYLIVLHDVGSKVNWNMLRLAFPANRNGSRILLTTRLPDVASSYCHHIHEMRSMNVDESWDLLRQIIFKGEPCPPKLEHIGKMIGRSCRGLPLAIEVVAGILSADLTQARWEDIAENMKTVVDGDDDEHPLQILSLSYTYLPHHLRPCLLYLGIFPQFHEIRVSKLIKLWVAEGFLNESECKSSEETGEEYLEELVKGSLVSVMKRRRSDGKVKRVSIHDLVRDFCRRQAKLENFFLHFTESASGSIQLQRRVTVADIENMLENIHGSTIRTIICLNSDHEGILCSLQYFRLLRILELLEAGGLFFFKWEEFLNQIFEQFHLRYLAFTVYKSRLNIPKVISKLENLQTLIIGPRVQLVELPVEIWRMRQLRHVILRSCVLPTQEEEEEMFALENLQTLDEAVNLVCSRDNLEMIPNLKKLCILYTNFSHPVDCQTYNLIYFQKLEVLKIRTWDWHGISPAFPPTLKRLSLSGLKLTWRDMKIVGLLPHLQELQLRDKACFGSKWETSEGGFSQLNFLLIDNSDLKHWITATTHFPVLNCLILLDCRNLREIPNDVGIFSFLLNILRGGGRRNTSYSELDEIEVIEKFLFFKKYLIVLDDVGSKEAWNMLRHAFPDTGNGSRIILTTRLPDLGSYYYHHIHEMRSMNVDESWDLLQQKIFKGEPCPPELKHIGKMIGRSCRGLTLAIEVVSGILSADLTQARWQDIAENMETVVDGDNDEHPLRILSLSYTYLPHHLRPCLLYLGIFPKVHEIRVSKLIKLWVAEGFLNESECQSLEETGEQYLEELVKGSLVSVIKRRKSDGRVKRVSIHDLVRDFCARQAKLDNFFLHFTESPVAAGAIQLQRRVTVADINNIVENVYGSAIRTIICLGSNCELITSSLQFFRLLRILDVVEARCRFPFTWYKFRDQIFEQFHLRYLAFIFYDSVFINIPKAISKLENLQTLIIRPMLQKPRLFVELPVEIWRMRQLRHVVVHSCMLPTQEGEEMSTLENLQTLDEAVNLVCSREMIPNLKKLCISYTNFSDLEGHQLYNLIYFQKLEVLKIQTKEGWYDSKRAVRLDLSGRNVAWEYMMKCPAFPQTLKRLSLSGLKLPWKDMKIVGLLPHLQELQLREKACVGRKWETSEGGFSQLNFLLIHNSDLEHWITVTTHFPLLNCLVLLDCRYLREVPNDIGRIPTLESVEVDEFNASLLVSAKSIQEDQQSSRNHSLQVRAVPFPFE